MSARAELRRVLKATRKAEKRGKPLPPQTGRMVTLENPVADQFPTFIIGNSVLWQVRAVVEAEAVMPPAVYKELTAEFARFRPSAAYAESILFHDTIETFAKERYIVQPDSATGQHIVICGAGPSLNETAAEWCPQADQVWGCNSALTWLLDHGHKATHGFTVDQTPHMVAEWATAPDVQYLIASTVHPHLTDLLVDKGRPFRFFHNHVGIRKPPVRWPNAEGVDETMSYEDWLYALLYPPTICAGSGLNAVTRAIDVATFMGAEKITVLGADCCLRLNAPPRNDLQYGSPEHLQWLRDHTVMHADGGHALASEATALTMHAEIDGRTWMTKTDLAITAQWLVKMANASGGRIQLIGDTLPVALLAKDDTFWKRMPNFVTADGQIANIPLMAKVPDDATKAAHSPEPVTVINPAIESVLDAAGSQQQPSPEKPRPRTLISGVPVPHGFSPFTTLPSTTRKTIVDEEPSDTSDWESD